MQSGTKADALVIGLLAASVVVSVVAASSIIYPESTKSNSPTVPTPYRSGNSLQNNNNQGLESSPAAQPPSSSTQGIPQSGVTGSPASSSPGAPPPITSVPQTPSNDNTTLVLYHSTPYFMPATWGAFIGALVWRGKIRTAWSKQGYGYDTFRLVARMRGSPIRVKLLGSVSSPKNRLQLANEFQVDWKTIDNHMQILEKSGLVEEKGVVGTTKYYSLTEHGRRVLSLLSESDDSTTNNNLAL